jgi:hypothetical protein
MQGYRRLGELLVARGHLTQEQLDHALALGADRKRFGERLVNLGFVQEHHVTEALAEQFGLPVFDLRSVRPESAAIRLVPYTQAMKALVLPISVRNGRFLCAVSDPLDFPLTDNLETRTGMRVDIGLAPASTLTATPSTQAGRPRPRQSARSESTRRRTGPTCSTPSTRRSHPEAIQGQAPCAHSLSPAAKAGSARPA